MRSRTVVLWGAGLALAVAGGWWLLRRYRPSPPADTILMNGRLEAREVDVATKIAGRVTRVLRDEGDSVCAGEVVATLDTRTLDLEREEASAELARARAAIVSSEALLRQRIVEEELARANAGRAERLAAEGVLPKQQLDDERTRAAVAKAAVDAARALLANSRDAVTAALARRNRISAEIDDATLTSPVGGLVLYRLAEPGSVLPAGGKVLTVVDLTDLHLEAFVPASLASRIAIGLPATVTIDGEPESAIPAEVSFVAAEAQFTPKHVETQAERERLVFRVKLRLAPEAALRLRPGIRATATLHLRPPLAE